MANKNLILDNSKLDFKKLFGLENDSDFIFTQGKIPLNTPLNNDLNQLVNNLRQKKFNNIFVIVNSVYNKTRIFYRIDDYKLFEKFRKSIIVIKMFLSRVTMKKKYNLRNHKFLSLEPIVSELNVVKLIDKNSIYRFTINELINIYRFSLHSISDDFYSNRKMEPPKNPYTNIPFSLKNNIIIYTEMCKYFLKKQKMLPIYVISFKESYFHIEKFCLKNFSFLMSKSIRSYIEQSSYRLFLVDFFDMIESDDDLIISYCTKCYHKINLKKIFSHSLHLFFLNSNGIYIFGNYKKEYIMTAKANNIYFGKDHSKLHFKKKKKVRLRSFLQSNPRNSLDSPYFLNSFNRQSDNLLNATNETVVNSTEENINIYSETQSDNNQTSIELANPVIQEANNNLTSKFNLILQNNLSDIYYLSNCHELTNLFQCKIDCLIFIYNSNNQKLSDLLHSIKSISSNFPFMVVDVKSIKIDNFVNRYTLINEDIDENSVILFQKKTPTLHIEKFQQKIDVSTIKLFIERNYSDLRKNHFLPNDTILTDILFNRVLDINDKDYWNIITNTYIKNQLVNIFGYFYSSKSISKDDLNRDIGSLKIIATKEKEFLIQKNILIAIIDIDMLQYDNIDDEQSIGTQIMREYDLKKMCVTSPHLILLKSNEIIEKDISITINRYAYQRLSFKYGIIID